MDYRTFTKSETQNSVIFIQNRPGIKNILFSCLAVLVIVIGWTLLAVKISLKYNFIESFFLPLAFAPFAVLFIFLIKDLHEYWMWEFTTWMSRKKRTESGWWIAGDKRIEFEK